MHQTHSLSGFQTVPGLMDPDPLVGMLHTLGLWGARVGTPGLVYHSVPLAPPLSFIQCVASLSPNCRPGVVCMREGCSGSVHLELRVWEEGGGHWASSLPLHIYELINRCPEGSSCRETSPPSPPRRESRWKIGASPHLGSGKKIFFFPPFSLKICSGLFEP